MANNMKRLMWCSLLTVASATLRRLKTGHNRVEPIVQYVDFVSVTLDSISMVKTIGAGLLDIGLTESWPYQEIDGVSSWGVNFGSLRVNLQSPVGDDDLFAPDITLSLFPVDQSLDQQGTSDALFARDLQHTTVVVPDSASTRHLQSLDTRDITPTFTTTRIDDLSTAEADIVVTLTSYPAPNMNATLASVNTATIQQVLDVTLDVTGMFRDSLRTLLDPIPVVQDEVVFAEGPVMELGSETNTDILDVVGFTLQVEDTYTAENVLVNDVGLTAVDDTTVGLGSLLIKLVPPPGVRPRPPPTPAPTPRKMPPGKGKGGSKKSKSKSSKSKSKGKGSKSKGKGKGSKRVI